MGQKVHPLGFRVGITKPHQSTWFARFEKYGYANAILEDRLIREKLLKLFPQLLNPVVAKKGKIEEPNKRTAKITEIKIERGLIPYEIAIGIYAGNCDLLKASLMNLKTSETILQNLQKNKRYLLELRSKLSTAGLPDLLNKKTMTASQSNEEKRNTKNVKLAQKRWRKRQSIRERSLERTSENICIVKNGSRLERIYKLKAASGNRNKKGLRRNQSSIDNLKNWGSKNKKRLADIFVSKINQSFLLHLKEELRYWNEKMVLSAKGKNEAPVGYSKKWNLNRLKALKNQPLLRLLKLGKQLQTTSLTQMEKLKKDYFEFGALTKMQTFAYYQMIQFIKGLKRLIIKLRKEQRAQKLLTLTTGNSARMSKANTEKLEKSILALTEKSLRKKLDNIDEECRKLQFIEYLQDIVKKHRTENIYFYLSTIAESRQSLKKIGQFTRNYSNFLFGVDLNAVKKDEKDTIRQQLEMRISKILRASNRKSEFEKGLSDIFLEQIQKQKQMYCDNITLTPKISLKFYSVKQSILESKASVIADNIVDDLEKRKAFRSVIKQAKEKLMASPGIKGVKIQVGGRLNGAEIARSEWVRSGRVPLQTLRANIDYAYKTANTIYGIIGVKVWIYKGSAKLPKASSLVR